VEASDIERTKSPKVDQTQANLGSPKAGKRLGDVGKFDEPDTAPNGDGKWTAPPYGRASSNDQLAAKKEDEALSKPSIVFVAHQQAKPHSGLAAGIKPVVNLGLATGYHVAARLETMATTAVHAPVTAIIEYNYERDGQILIPAGSRAVGKVSQADPSGLMNITFSSIEFPSGETVAIDAVAADMSFQALKGKVTGKHAGKSLMVRSLSGIGETAAMIVGAPSQNSAFSPNDLLRMRIADNMGNAGDEQVMRMMTMEHIVVSVPAGTEIYVIFEKASTAKAATEENLQIPPELNSGSESSSAPQP
jgi:type IV secretory pathway VirB10-like protein